jgi:nucleoside-diphosphate-sugar epimerase
VWIPIVDVRDVAAGQRFLVSGGPAISLNQIGAVLKGNLGDAAQRVPSRSIPDIAVRIASVFLKEFRSVVPDLGFARKPSSEKARRVLGWQPRKPEEAIIATAESLVRKQLVKA